MDLKDFKIKSESEDSYHVEHPSGRSFTFMKKSLSPKALAMVQKLAKGGEVSNYDDGGGVQTPEALKPSDDAAQKQAPTINIDVGNPNNIPAQNNEQQDKPQEQAQSSEPSLFEQGVNTVLQHAGLPSAQAIGQAAKSIGNKLVSSGVIDPTGQGGQNQAQPQAAVPQGKQQQAPQPQTMAQSQPQRVDPYLQSMQDQNALLGKEQQNIEQMSGGLNKGLEQQQQAYQDFINQQKGMKTPQQIADEYKAKDDALMQNFMNKSIDPNRYYKNQSTGSKILSTIAILVGGLAGSNVKNQALAMTEQAVNNDIEAQKNDQSKAMNLWKMNRENMQNDLQANIATQNQLYSSVQAKMALAASGIQNTQARMNLQQAISDIEQKKINNRLMLSGMSGPTGGSSDGPVNYSKFNALQRSGVLGPQEVTAATKEANDLESVRALRKEYVDSFKKLENMTASGAFSPNQRDALINALSAKIAKQSAGRYNLDEATQIVRGMFPSKTDVGEGTAKLKFQKGLGYFDAEEAGASTLKRYGLLNPAPSASLSQEGMTGTYKGRPVVMKNGQWVYR